MNSTTNIKFNLNNKGSTTSKKKFNTHPITKRADTADKYQENKDKTFMAKIYYRLLSKSYH